MLTEEQVRLLAKTNDVEIRDRKWSGLGWLMQRLGELSSTSAGHSYVFFLETKTSILYGPFFACPPTRATHFGVPIQDNTPRYRTNDLPLGADEVMELCVHHPVIIITDGHHDLGVMCLLDGLQNQHEGTSPEIT